MRTASAVDELAAGVARARHAAGRPARRRRHAARPCGGLMALAIGLFAAALVVIATERIDRTKVALIGAVLVVLTQTIEQDAAIAAIDCNTLGLLAGMMLLLKVTEPTGVYTCLG